VTVVGSWNSVPLFGTLADQSSMLTAGTGLPVDGHMLGPSQQAAVGMHVGYPATMNDMNAMMMMSDVYHGNPSALDQSAVKHLFHSVTSTFADSASHILNMS